MEDPSKLFDDFADEYYQKYFDVSLYRESLDFLIVNLESNDSVLDIGCGPGNMSNYLLSQKPQLKILATDLSPRMLELANKVPGVDTMLLDCRDINSINQKFDCIICSFCIPYISTEEVKTFLQDCHDQLNDNGTLYLSFILGESTRPEVKTSSTGELLTITYYDETFIIEQLNEAGFEIAHQQQYTSYNQIDADMCIVSHKRT